MFLRGMLQHAILGQVDDCKTWVGLIVAHNSDPQVLYFDAAKLSKAIARDEALALEMDIMHDVLIECCSIFCCQYKPICSGSAGRSAVWCYYAAKPGNIPNPPE